MHVLHLAIKNSDSGIFKRGGVVKMLRVMVLVLVVSTSFSGLSFAQSNGDGSISKSQAVKRVKKVENGRVLKVDQTGQIYRVKVLKKSGRVVSVDVDKRSGKVNPSQKKGSSGH